MVDLSSKHIFPPTKPGRCAGSLTLWLLICSWPAHFGVVAYGVNQCI